MRRNYLHLVLPVSLSLLTTACAPALLQAQIEDVDPYFARTDSVYSYIQASTFTDSSLKYAFADTATTSDAVTARVMQDNPFAGKIVMAELTAKLKQKANGLIDVAFSFKNINSGYIDMGKHFDKIVSGFKGLSTTPCQYKIRYDISLAEVERPAHAKKRYGSQQITKTSQNNVDRQTFEDGLVSISWNPQPKSISFDLKNNTEHSIKVIWDDASFIDFSGRNHRIIHSGVKYAERNNSQAPSVVSRKGRLEDLVYPSDYIDMSNGNWVETPLFPTEAYGRFSEINKVKSEAEERIGQKFQVLLPIKIEDTINDYIFTFSLDKCMVERQ